MVKSALPVADILVSLMSTIKSGQKRKPDSICISFFFYVFFFLLDKDVMRVQNPCLIKISIKSTSSHPLCQLSGVARRENLILIVFPISSVCILLFVDEDFYMGYKYLRDKDFNHDDVRVSLISTIESGWRRKLDLRHLYSVTIIICKHQLFRCASISCTGCEGNRHFFREILDQ